MVGLEIYNTIFAKGDVVGLVANKDKSVKVVVHSNDPPYLCKPLGYLIYEQSVLIHKVLQKYKNKSSPDPDFMCTHGVTIEVGNRYQVLIEIDFYNTIQRNSPYMYKVRDTLDTIPGRVKPVHHFWEGGEDYDTDDIDSDEISKDSEEE